MLCWGGQQCFRVTQNLQTNRLISSLLCSVEEVCEAFQSAGVCEVKNMTDLGESTFCRDPLCPDTLVFSQQLHALLQHSSLTVTHALNTQVRMNICVCVVRCVTELNIGKTHEKQAVLSQEHSLKINLEERLTGRKSFN